MHDFLFTFSGIRTRKWQKLSALEQTIQPIRYVLSAITIFRVLHPFKNCRIALGIPFTRSSIVLFSLFPPSLWGSRERRRTICGGHMGDGAWPAGNVRDVGAVGTSRTQSGHSKVGRKRHVECSTLRTYRILVRTTSEQSTRTTSDQIYAR